MTRLQDIFLEDGTGSPQKPHQQIFFGPPGTGKSHLARMTCLKDVNDPDIFTVCFHPDMASGDFMGRLLPQSTASGQICYRFHPGTFLLAVARAYQTLLTEPHPVPVALMIDEINRGNAPAVFGKIFQLLDRESNGWSSYDTVLTAMEIEALAQAIGLRIKRTDETVEGYAMDGAHDDRLALVSGMLMNQRLRLPPNLSLVGTMNTADESIFYLDSAFKRRWSWQYVKNTRTNDRQFQAVFTLGTRSYGWVEFVDALNVMLRSKGDRIRKIEDKLIGYWFCKHDEGVIESKDLADKICFHLWDSVFPRNKDVLEEMIGLAKGSLLTFGDFRDNFENLVAKLIQAADQAAAA